MQSSLIAKYFLYNRLLEVKLLLSCADFYFLHPRHQWVNKVPHSQVEAGGQGGKVQGPAQEQTRQGEQPGQLQVQEGGRAHRDPHDQDQQP